MGLVVKRARMSITAWRLGGFLLLSPSLSRARPQTFSSLKPSSDLCPSLPLLCALYSQNFLAAAAAHFCLGVTFITKQTAFFPSPLPSPLLCCCCCCLPSLACLPTRQEQTEQTQDSFSMHAHRLIHSGILGGDGFLPHLPGLYLALLHSTFTQHGRSSALPPQHLLPFSTSLGIFLAF